MRTPPHPAAPRLPLWHQQQRWWLSLLSCLAVAACATHKHATPPSHAAASARSVDEADDVTTSTTAGALDAQRGWWRALAIRDTAYLAAHAGDSLTLTVSSGRTFDRAATIAQAAPPSPSPPAAGGAIARTTAPAPITFGWSEEHVRLVAPGIALATARATESAALASSAYRYVTLLERTRTPAAGSTEAWRVVYAQSTGEAVFTPRLTTAAAGSMQDYVGEYRGPRGGSIRIVARDSVLALIEPSGRERRLEPIGPSVFEFDYVVPAGAIVRIAFVRDARGHVTAANRLIPGIVNTFVRVR